MSQPKHPPLSIRVAPETRGKWKAEAEKVGLSLNAWVVQTLNNACREATGVGCLHPEGSRQPGAAGTVWCGDCGQQAMPV